MSGLLGKLSASSPWLDPVADTLKQLTSPLLGENGPRAVKDLLYGTWMGHPLHPFLILRGQHFRLPFRPRRPWVKRRYGWWYRWPLRHRRKDLADALQEFAHESPAFRTSGEPRISSAFSRSDANHLSVTRSHLTDSRSWRAFSSS